MNWPYVSNMVLVSSGTVLRYTEFALILIIILVPFTDDI